MLYLEDYLEIIEHLPQELRDRFTEMREMDLQVQNAMDSLEDRVKHFFGQAKKLKPEQREADFKKLRQDYHKALEDAEEKVQIANQIYDLVDRYLRRLDQELQKFKMELEADNAGITEILERRSLELDNPPQPVNHQPKAEKRKYNPPANSVSHSEKRVTTEKVQISSNSSTPVPTPIQEILQEPVKYRAPTGTLTPTGVNTPTPLNHASSNTSAALMTAATTAPCATAAAAALGPQQPIAYSLGHMGPGSNAIAAAASQAIAATQQMQQGRRTASLKASFEVVSSGLQGISREFSIGRDLATASAGVANSVGPTMPTQEIRSTGRQKKQSTRVIQAAAPPESPTTIEEMPDSAVPDDNGQGVDWTFDPNEPRYCICNQVSYGDMVACDNEDCPFEWFHYPCVGITQPPKGKWYCPQCTSSMRRRGRKDR